MNHHLHRLALLLLVIWAPMVSVAQTAGAGIVSTIESKASQIDQNDKKVAELNRKRMQSYAEEQEKLNRLKAEQAELQRKKDGSQAEVDRKIQDKLREIANNSSWQNRLKSARSGWKERNPGTCGAGGPPPVCPVDHWYRVSVSEAMAEYEAHKQKELDKIRKLLTQYDAPLQAKQDEVRKFEYAENEFTRKRADWDKQMDELKERNDNLRQEIVELSKQYKDRVVAEAKGLQSQWASDLMFVVAKKHVIEDYIDIYNVKLSDLQAEEAKLTAELREKVRKRNEEEIADLNDKAHTLNLRLIGLEPQYQQKLSVLNSNHRQLTQQLQDINQKLQNTGKLKPEEIAQLTAQKENLEQRIASSRKEITDTETNFKNEQQKLTADIKSLKDKAWDLTINLSKRQDDALVGLKDAFATKRRILSDAIVARKASLQETGDLLIQKKASYRQKNNEYANRVDAERIRMLKACNLAGASCYGNDTHSEVVARWSAASGCVGGMEGNRSIGTYYGCTDEAPVYQQHYASLRSGLSDSDLSALQRSTSKTKYDLILHKVTN